MKEVIRAFVAVDAGVDEKLVQNALPFEANVQIVGVVTGLEESWQTLQETTTDLLVVACAGYSDRALYLIEGAVREKPSRPVVVFTEQSPNGFLRRLFEAGADDVITLPEQPSHVTFALQKALARKSEATANGKIGQSPMVCILGPKGGTGKTLTATNMAVALAEKGQRVALVDLDLQFGDVGLCLGLAPQSTIYDLIRSGGSLDADKLDAYMVNHSSGLDVLLAPSRPDQASAVSVEFLREIYTTLRASYDYVVVDTPPGFTPEVIVSIDNATDVCMVAMLDSLSLKNTKLGLETLELMGFNPDRVRIILNRAQTRVGITPDDVVAIIGRKPDVLVPSDREIPRAVNEGKPIVEAKRGSEAASAFVSLAELYVEDARAREVTDTTRPAAGPLRRLIGRRA